jgi:hypothetical protein
MGSLAFLLLLVLLVWFWQTSLATRDRAIVTARETCKHNGLQLLDGTTSLQNIRPYYSRTNGPGFKRTYTFDYSEDGITRQNGCIVMHNMQITAVLLDG